MPSPSLYTAAVEISEDFLGPAGKRFLDRQIVTHLDVEPDKLRPKHLEELVEWVRLSFAVLTNDTKQVKKYSDQLLNLRSEQTTVFSPEANEASHGHKH